MKTLSIISYLLIFLPGSMISLPLGLFLLTGIFTAEPAMRVLIILADLSILTLLYVSIKPKTQVTLAIELTVFILLLLPLLRLVLPWPLSTFNYFLFIVPLALFVILYLISFIIAVREYRKELKSSA